MTLFTIKRVNIYTQQYPTMYDMHSTNMDESKELRCIKSFTKL